MIHAQDTKSVVVIKPQSVATNATATGNIDRLGYDFCQVNIVLDSASSTSSKPATLDLLEADDTNATSFATVASFVSGTDFTVPAADTQSAQIIKWDVDCRTRKRYLRVRSTAGGAAQIQCVTADLHRAEIAPTTATLKGLAAWVKG